MTEILQPSGNTQFNSTAEFSLSLLPAVSDFENIDDFFFTLINPIMINKIVEYTNKRLKDSQDKISFNEMVGFFGLMLLFGVTKSVDVNEIYNSTSPHHINWASACMSRDRFKLICQNISFDDIDTRLNRIRSNPKFHKMDEIFASFKSNIQKCMTPGSKLTIDEQLYAFRGKCKFKQYIGSKPAKYGFKIWALVCASSGYLVDCNVYLGIIILFLKSLFTA